MRWHHPGTDSVLPSRFRDRREAGRILADKLLHYGDEDDVVVLALPRGGVPVAFEIATALSAPLDVFVVRKLGVPGHEELAMGAIATGDVRVINDEVRHALNISDETIARVAAQELKELGRRESAYRAERRAVDVGGRTVILVDDGLATGASMRAAVHALRSHHPARIVVAVPVGAPISCEEIAELADDVVCARSPEAMSAISMWYEDFDQTTDAEVHALLAQAAAPSHARMATHGR